MRPCPVCGLETDCQHRKTEDSEVYNALSGCYDDGYKEGFRAGLRRAMKIAEDFETGGDDGCHCASVIMQAIEQEIK